MGQAPIRFRVYQAIALSRSNLSDSLLLGLNTETYSNINIHFLTHGYQHTLLQDALKMEYGD
jgi:hypothetical protein